MSIANDFERQMLSLINEERAAAGLDPVELATSLNQSSEDHSSWMLQSDTFSHTGQGGSSATDRMRDADFTFSGSWASAENIAWQSERGAEGIADDVVDLHDSLMDSPGHRANILNPDFDYVGIGIERGDYKGWDGVMVTQNFARTGASVELDTAAPDQGEVTVSQNAAPVISVEDITLAKLRGAHRTDLDDQLRVKDADGDAIARFELHDTEGRDNFRFRGEGRIDADTPYRVDAEDLDMIRVVRDRHEGESTLSIHASDGETVGEWESFTLNTVDPDEMIFV